MADEEGNNREVKKSGRNPVLSLLLILNGIIMGVIAWMQYDLHKTINKKFDLQDVIKADLEQQEGKEGELEAVVGDQEILFRLEGFTANLAQGEGPRRFIKINLVLKLSKQSNEEEVKARKPQIRDTIINTLNIKRPEDLLDVKGKLRLKEDLKTAINTFLIDGEVVDIYYVSFQIN